MDLGLIGSTEIVATASSRVRVNWSSRRRTCSAMSISYFAPARIKVSPSGPSHVHA